MSACAVGHLPPGALAARRRRRWHTLLGRQAAWIAPNSGSPRAWASAPSCGGCTRSQPTLPARRTPGGALRRRRARGELLTPDQLRLQSFSQPWKPKRGQGSGAVGRGLQSEDTVEVFARSCGSVCNKPPPHNGRVFEGRCQSSDEGGGARAVAAGLQGPRT